MTYNNNRYAPLVLCLSVLLASCGSGSSDGVNDSGRLTSITDVKLSSLIRSRGLTGDPSRGLTIPSIESNIADLGKRLFYSKSISGNRDTACASCHHPKLGGGDDLTLPVGVEAENPDLLGPGRKHAATGQHHDGGPTVPRNAPTTFNIALWNTFLFHDGRIETDENNEIRTPDTAFGTPDPLAGPNMVHAQARFPLTSKEEMKGFTPGITEKTNPEIRNFIGARLGGYGEGTGLLTNTDYWVDKFRNGFNAPNAAAESIVTEQNAAFAISEYQRSQLFINSPWKAYVEGNSSALSQSAKEGASLFFTAKALGGAGCASCHSGDFFTDEGFHNIGIPQMGRGKGDGSSKTEDFGRWRETKQDMDMFAFRTPSLLNVEETGPWGHSGAYTTLEGIVRHHLDPQNALDNYDANQLTQTGVQNLDSVKINTQKALDHSNFALVKQELSDAQVAHLVEFLKSLTDPCVKSASCLQPWTLDANDDPDPNGDQLVAEFQ